MRTPDHLEPDGSVLTRGGTTVRVQGDRLTLGKAGFAYEVSARDLVEGLVRFGICLPVADAFGD